MYNEQCSSYAASTRQIENSEINYFRSHSVTRMSKVSQINWINSKPVRKCSPAYHHSSSISQGLSETFTVASNSYPSFKRWNFSDKQHGSSHIMKWKLNWKTIMPRIGSAYVCRWFCSLVCFMPCSCTDARWYKKSFLSESYSKEVSVNFNFKNYWMGATIFMKHK